MRSFSISLAIFASAFALNGCVTDSDYQGGGAPYGDSSYQSQSQPYQGSSAYGQGGQYYETSSTGQRLICHDEVVAEQAAPSDQHRLVGTIAGAAVGGLVGNQFGGGDTNKALTAAGVVAGGYAGNQVQKRMQQGNTQQSVRKVCVPAP